MYIRKMGYNNISGIRRTKETQEASKAVFEKQRKRLLQEVSKFNRLAYSRLNRSIFFRLKGRVI